MSNSRKYAVFFLFVLTSLLFSGCSSGETDLQAITSQVILSGDQSVGQTFYSRFRGLSGIELFIDDHGTGEGEVILSVYKTPDKSTLLSQVSSPILSLKEGESNFFDLPTILPSNQQTLYFEVTTDSSSAISLGALPGSSYIDGAAYKNKSPIDQTLSFDLQYAWFQVGISIIIWLVRTIQSLFFAFLLFFLPGYGILTIFDLFKIIDTKTFIIKTALSIAISLAVYPVILLWTNALGLQIGRLNAYLPMMIGTSLIFYHYFQTKTSITIEIRRFLTMLVEDSNTWSTIWVVVITISVIFTSRYWSIRDIPAPLWGDSVHHTAMAQLILDNGGLFTSWEPIAPYQSLTIHWGFSALAAVYAWFTGESILSATLIVGQLINVFALLTPVLLIIRFVKKPEWGLVGFLISIGLFSIIPGIYTSWGRYAQLAGQVILPAVAFLSVELLHNPNCQSKFFNLRRKRLFVITALLLAGMTLTHYRLPIFWISLFGMLFVYHQFRTRAAWKEWWLDILSLSSIIGLFAILIAPWLPRLFNSNLALTASTSATPINPNDWIISHINQWSDLPVYIPIFILSLFIISLVYAVSKKQFEPVLYAIWPILIMAYMVGVLINLPFANLLEGFAIKIMTYIPVGLAIGWAVSEIFSRVSHYFNRITQSIVTLSVVILCFVGWEIQSLSVHPNTYAIVTHPDIKAMNWIEQNTPEDSVFLVEGFRVHYGYSAVGADAGWWIPLLTGRDNTMPPQYAMVNELPSPPDGRQIIVDLVEFLETHEAVEKESVEYLCDFGITHIYIGQGQGLTGAGVSQLFSPTEFLANPDDYHLIYHQDRIYIFELTPSACSQ